MAIPISTSRSHLYQAVSLSRQQSDDLQRQLATGLRSETYGGLGLERRQVIEFNADISQITGYLRGIDQAQVRIDILDETLTQIRDTISNSRSSSLSTNFDLDTEGKTLFQNESYARFHDVASILNTEAGGRYIYGGRNVSEKPVVAPDEILEGAGSRAGFYQIADERQQADLGADLKGRLVVSQPSASEVNLAEDGTHPFGFKISGLNNALSGVTATGPAGSPAAINLDIGANSLQDGERVTVQLTLPDGTQRDIQLTATSGTPDGVGEFQIGASAGDTANNLTAALNTELLRVADTELRAASQFAAADDFFDFDDTTPPQRVDGPPFDSATGLIDGTSTDTVFWYQGEFASDDPRGSQQVKVDDYIHVEYGARANEEAFTSALKNLAVASYDSYSSADANAQDRYDAVRSRVTTNLSEQPSQQHIDHILAEVSAANAVITTTKERHETHNNLLQQFVDEEQNVDIYEVSAKLLDLQTRLSATYQTMASLQQLSLVNFI